MVYLDRATLQFDGACQPNPGEGGGGYVLTDEYGDTIFEGQLYIGGDCTNNVAEYLGLIAGLKHLRDSDHDIGHLCIEGDSALVINQLNQFFSVRNNRLRPLYNRAMDLLERNVGFDSYEIYHIDRSYNNAADSLARNAIYEQQGYSSDYY